jgi:PAS domain S-box-containing protein
VRFIAKRPDETIRPPAFSGRPVTWAALAVAAAGVVVVLELATTETVFVGLLAVPALLAAIRLHVRATMVISALTALLAIAIGVAGEGMPEQRLVSAAVAVMGSLIAVWVSVLREAREAAARRLAAQHSVARAGAESATLAEAAPRMLQAIGETLGWDVGALWEADPPAGVLRRVAVWHRRGVDFALFDRLSAEASFAPGEGLPGRVWKSGHPAWVVEVMRDPGFVRAAAADAAGLTSAFAFPLRFGAERFGAMEFFSRERRPPDRDLLEMMATFGAQVGQYIETKRAEQAVRRSDALKSAILRSALDCVITMDHRGVILEFNPAAERTFGYSREQAVGQELAELVIPPPLRARHREGLARYLETGEGPLIGSRLELTGMRSDGGRFPVELSVTPIPGSDPPLFAGYLRDITDRRRAEEELHRSRDQLDAILGGLADGVTVQDAAGELVYANPAAARVMGFASPGELVAAGRDDVLERFEIFAEDGEPLSLESLPGRRALRGEAPGELVVRFRRRGGEGEVWTVVKSAPVRDEGGAVVLAVTIFEDITEHKRSEVAQRFLADASRLLGASLDFETTLESIARLAVPGFADWCAVDLVAADGRLERVALAHVQPEKVTLGEEMSRLYPSDPGAERGVAAVIRSGAPALYPDIPDEMLTQAARDEDHLGMLRALGFRSAMLVPLPGFDRTLGAMSFVTAKSGRRFDEHDLALAEELGRRAATAIENARLYGERARMARTLQEGLLPPHLPSIPGIDVAARYRAAGEAAEMGGDFYDVFETSGDCWAVAIGDVCGKGADAAAITALARYTLRAAAMYEQGPARILERLNEALLRQRDDRQFCTVAYAHLEIGDGRLRLRLASGGHPLPLVVRADGRVEEVGRPGTLLGVVEDPEIPEEEVELLPGERIVFFTDGVTEARIGGGLFGAERLAGVLAGAAELDAAATGELIELAVTREGDAALRDDLAVLVLRLAGGAHRGEAEPVAAATISGTGLDLDVLLPPTPEAVPTARHALAPLAEQLDTQRFEDLRLLVSELVANSVRHGRLQTSDWIGLSVTRSGRAIRVQVSDPGQGFSLAEARSRERGDQGGFGLYLVEQIAARWGMQHRHKETNVWFELDGRAG